METGEVLTRTAVFIGVAAIIKIVLAFLPNVELLTLWIAIVTLVYGLKMGILVAFFGNLTADIYVGFGPWTVFISAGFVLVAIVFWMAKSQMSSSFSYALVAVGATVLFDIFTVATSMTLLFGYSLKMALFQQYGLFVPPAYLPFGWIHLGCSAISFYFLAEPLISRLKAINRGGVITTKSADA